jgi:hypothetical protein
MSDKTIFLPAYSGNASRHGATRHFPISPYFVHNTIFEPEPPLLINGDYTLKWIRESLAVS